jgi:hypothetical protein
MELKLVNFVILFVRKISECYDFFAVKQGSQMQGQKSHNFYEKLPSRPYFDCFWQKYCPPGWQHPNSVWRTRFSEQSFYFTSIYMLTGDQKSEGNLHNATF